MTSTPPPAPTTRCKFRSCRVSTANTPRIECYAPGCDRALHSFCYDLGVLRKNLLGHFDASNPEHPFLKIACKKECHKKAYRHFANMNANPEDRNIPWNRDGHGGEDDPNNSENILIGWLQHPGNYNKFRSPPSGKTKAAVCEEVSKKIYLAKTLKVRKALSVQLKIQSMEGAFRDAHDWVNNTGVGVLASDGRVTFEEAVTKRFTYYYDLVDVMSERSSARPKASTDTMKMTGLDDDDDDDDDDSRSSNSSPSLSKSDRDDDGVEDDDDDAVPVPEEEEDGSPTFASPPSPSPVDEVPTILASASPVAGSGSYSTLTAETSAVEVSAEKRKNKARNKKAKAPTRKNNKRKGTAMSPHAIDVDDDSWQVSMLDIRRGEVDLQHEKWSSQKQQQSMELELQQEKWKSESKQQNLEYKFDLMVKYKKLQAEGFDNHQIVQMIPDMRPIMDKSNMPVSLQLTQSQSQAPETS
jgi:hypothetical protein